MLLNTKIENHMSDQQIMTHTKLTDLWDGIMLAWYGHHDGLLTDRECEENNAISGQMISHGHGTTGVIES